MGLVLDWTFLDFGGLGDFGLGLGNNLLSAFTDVEVSSEADPVEGVNTMEYMVENLMKKIDENKDKNTGNEVSPSVGIPVATMSSTSMPASSQILSNSNSACSQSGDHRYQDSLTENIEKLKKVLLKR